MHRDEGLAQHHAIQTAFKQVVFQELWVSLCITSTLIIVAFPDCLDKGFLNLMGNIATHKIGTHLIDSDTALKGKLIHYTDSMDSPAQGKLITHHLLLEAHNESQVQLLEDGWSKRLAFT